jgi:hypothetical protein
MAGALDIGSCSWPDAALGLTFLTVLVVALSALGRWGREALDFSQRILASLAVLFVIYAGYSAAKRIGTTTAANGLQHPGGAPLVLPVGARPPDIIHIVFDGLGRLDELGRSYGLDAPRIATALRAQNMQFNDAAVANYSQTYPAVAAMLSMDYLDEAVRRARSGNDRRIAETIIHDSTVIRALKARGYTFTLLSSGYEALVDHPQADDGIYGPTLFDQFESYLLPRTMLRIVPASALTYEPQRRRTMELLAALEDFEPADHPRFVLAHVLLPHPPFLFMADGRDVTPAGVFSIQDGNAFPGTSTAYRQGYAQQARFVFLELERLLARWQRLSPPPIVIVHGDHGPGLGYDIRTPERSNMRGRMRIFLGVQGDARIGPIGSPVNIYRQLFRAVFGADLMALPDRSFVSSWARPYDFTEVQVQ